MNKKLICIECPEGCELTAEIEAGQIMRLSGNKCPRGEKYAQEEIQNPVRTFTGTVLLVMPDNLSLAYNPKMLPVKTSRPIPKSLLLKAAEQVKKLKLVPPVKAGQVIAENFLMPGTNLVAGRSIQ
jgi:CxxC motif-containing protein